MIDGLFIVLGLIGLIYSSDKFVDGASNLALNLKMPVILVGILIVGIGTSAPEILVSSSAALQGSDLALGNAIGSNIANIALIIGVTALLIPITVKRTLIKKEFVLLIGATALGTYLLSDGALTRFDAILFLLSLIFVLYFFIANAKTQDNVQEVEEIDAEPMMTMKKSIALTSLGMIALIGFSKLLVMGAVGLAQSLGVNDVVIGLTIVSVGTSLPELSSCIMAAKKGKEDLAIGNIVGSNIFNILAVLAASGIINPMEVKSELLMRDIPLMCVLTIGFLLVSLSPKEDGKIKRFEGFIFLSVFCLYITSLVLDSMGIINTMDLLNNIKN